MHIQMLIDILKNKGTIQGDDVQAFDSVVRNDPASAALFLEVKGQYKSFADKT